MATITTDIDYTTTGSGETGISNDEDVVAGVNYGVAGAGSVTLETSPGTFRVVLVTQTGTPIANIENAKVNSIGFKLNSWEDWSFSLPVNDPKAKYILAQSFCEAQIWHGDVLLSWGPINKPTVNNGVLTCGGVGAGWYLSRRFVGKANRDNMLKNPSFESGLANWNFMKGKFFLDYTNVPANQVVSYGPGKEGGNSKALEISVDNRPVSPPPGAVGSGTIVTHTVVTGDTLWKLAQTYLGSGIYWKLIYAANADLIKNTAIAHGLWNPNDPGHWIFPGMSLVVKKISAPQVQPKPPDNNVLWGAVFGYQEFTVTTNQRGATFTMTGYVKVPSQYFINWGFGAGLRLARLRSDYKTNNMWTKNGWPNTWGGRRAYYTDTIETTSTRLAEGHPLNGWIRHEVSLEIPPNTTEVIHARVEAIAGKTYWDKLTLTRDTAFEYFDTDQATIIKNLVTHAQDPAFDKSSVNITSSTPATKQKRDIVALHSEHANIWDLIVDHTTYEKGVDVSMQYTPTSRVLTTHYPYKGRDITPLHLRLGRNIKTYDWSYDGDSAASSTIVLGSGSGSGREEAVAKKPTAFANNLLLETLISAGPEIALDQLQAVANEFAAVNHNPTVINVTTYPHNPDDTERRFIGYVDVGDQVPVSIFDGPLYDGTGKLTGYTFVVNAVYRIVELTINEDLTLTISLNRRDFGLA